MIVKYIDLNNILKVIKICNIFMNRCKWLMDLFYMCILDILNIKVKKKYVKYKVILEWELWGYIYVIVLFVNILVID